MNQETRTKWLHSLFSKDINDIGLFERALTHGSTGKDDYQRLEFLGDRVLGLVVSSTLYEIFATEPEGRLSQRLNGLVSGKTCAEVGRKIDIGSHMNIGKQARDDGAKDSDNVLGDMMEALIGALYLDQGLEAARSFILIYWKPMMTATRKVPKHPKSDLQEWCAANNRKVPSYAITKKEGPSHNLKFEITLTVNGFEPLSAVASSKQAGETLAAKLFLEQNT